MDTIDPTAEWRFLSEHYRQMSDNELLVLARQISELTDVAQQALTSEMSQRGLKLQPEEPLVAPRPAPPLDPSYDEDRELVEVRTVWSLSDALQLQTLLDGAGIPFFMGPEKAPAADAVTSNFANGVSVQIMRVGLPWTHSLLRDYKPVNEPVTKSEEELDELAVRCPKCHSEEVVFDGLAGDGLIDEGPSAEPAAATDKSQPKFEWTCDSCGHHWEDDGIVDE
jgi:DNA-directed RNA polymerase subunit M/transcription elongation factor TFIIS